MAEYDQSQATTTELHENVDDVTVSSETPDTSSGYGKSWWDYPKADKYLGYYKNIPELKSALRVLARRVAGLGWEADNRTKAILENITGWGEDSFDSIMQQMVIEKKVFGDAFAEVIRNDDGTLINIKKLYTGDMRVYTNEQGIVEEYMQVSNHKKGEGKTFQPQEILHLTEDRIGNEIHGTSIIISLKKIIDAKNEALTDERKIRHRELALGILYVDTDDATKISDAKSEYQEAVDEGEVLVLPEGVAEIKDNPNKGPRDRIRWLQYLDNLFYQVVGTPKVLVTSEGYTEAGGKAGLLAFEPTEISEKRGLEQDLWNQLAIKIEFTRTPSLLGEAIGTEQKNAGQTGVQPNETEVRPTRTE